MIGKRSEMEVLTKSKPKKGELQINLFADSQGRNVASNFLSKSNQKIFSSIKPNAKFDFATADAERTQAGGVAVLLAGTNDVGHNESKELLSSVRKRLCSLRSASVNTLIFSVPHRHDLPTWSCVNTEVQEVNGKIERLCKHFTNVHFVDISRLGRRFYTRQGFHLNMLGRKFVCDKILEHVNMLSLCPPQSIEKSIPLTYITTQGNGAC